MNKKILISDFPFPKQIKNKNVIFSRFYNELSLFNRIMHLFGVSLEKEVNNDWIDLVNQSDIIILFDTLKDYAKEVELIENICRMDCRLIFYAWNPISYSNSFDRLSKRWEKYTFSKKDAIKYNIEYKGPFHFFESDISCEEIKFDGYFVGLEKGRSQTIEKIIDLYHDSRLSPEIQIVDNIKALFNKRYYFYKSYDETCKYVKQSRSIIEVVQKGQDGVTLRSMESIFYQKKLVTNNIAIMDYDFYTPQNIFILGKDNPHSFRDFILGPYQELPVEITEHYKFNNWLSSLLS